MKAMPLSYARISKAKDQNIDLRGVDQEAYEKTTQLAPMKSPRDRSTPHGFIVLSQLFAKAEAIYPLPGRFASDNAGRMEPLNGGQGGVPPPYILGDSHPKKDCLLGARGSAVEGQEHFQAGNFAGNLITLKTIYF